MTDYSSENKQGEDNETASLKFWKKNYQISETICISEDIF